MIPKILTLVRGLPGIGKSTFANFIWNDYAICEADKFFYDSEGHYLFDASKLREAHKWCRDEVETRMKDNELNPQYYPEIDIQKKNPTLLYLPDSLDVQDMEHLKDVNLIGGLIMPDEPSAWWDNI